MSKAGEVGTENNGTEMHPHQANGLQDQLHTPRNPAHELMDTNASIQRKCMQICRSYIYMHISFTLWFGIELLRAFV